MCVCLCVCSILIVFLPLCYSSYLRLFVSSETTLTDTFWPLTRLLPCGVSVCVGVLTCVFSLQGERLRIPPDQCCPECVSVSQDSCQYEGAIYGVSKTVRAAKIKHEGLRRPKNRVLRTFNESQKHFTAENI